MKSKIEFGFVVEYVKDIEAARAFYVEILGLKVQRQHPSFIQFEHFALATDEPMGGEAQQELYWLVDDAEAAFSDLSQKCEVTLPLQDVPFGKVFGVRDPDGQPRYLLEFSKNRPSRPAE